MNRYVKLILAVAATAGYYLVLRYVAPTNEPYFILGIALVGFIAWLYGMVAGLAMFLILTPGTLFIYKQFDFSISYSGFAYSPPYITLEILVAVAMGRIHRKVKKLSQEEHSLREVNQTLQASLSQVREMGGIHSLCTSCKSILDDDGTWTKIDAYLKEKTKAEFSHGLCPECASNFDVETATQAKPAAKPEPEHQPAS